MEECLISVIVPAYNVDQYLKECIESIINQTYSFLEIILVDDGSTDRSGKICDQYADMDDRIIVIHKENGGLVTARKAGLSIAKGEYIGFVDGDDYVEPDFYEVLHRELEEKKVDFIQCSGIKEGEGEYILPHYIEERCIVSDRQEVINCLFRNYFRHEDYINVNVWNKLFRGEFIKKCYKTVPDFQQYGEDTLCMCECLLRCRSFSSMDKRLYHYRMREGSLSHGTALEMMEREYSLRILLKIKLLEYNRYSPVVEMFFDEWFSNILHAYWRTPSGERLTRYRFPELEWLKGKRVVLYGAGMVGESYYRDLSLYSQIKIVGWADKRADKMDCDYLQIIMPDEIKDIDYDVLIIAVLYENVAKKIMQELALKGIEKEKIIWEKPQKLF